MAFISEERMKLPIFQSRPEILKLFRRKDTIIFVGDTGCGKTTQIPQYLLESGYARHKCIAVTQPRRVAAVTIAKRVAIEMKTKVGDKVGFSVRFENVTSPATKIKFLTDGLLLREAVNDNLLLEYSVVILDEAHERTLSNDLLLGLVKSTQLKRKEQGLMPLKIIVMSATLQADKMAAYFPTSETFFIQGREFCVYNYYLPTTPENYVHTAMVCIFQIHQKEDEGDILVFCTGQDEIDYMVSECKLAALMLPQGIGPVKLCPFYGALPREKKLEVFDAAPPGWRKVIFATNIAETSITIENVKYVVDTMKVKAKSFNSVCGFDVLRTQTISKAQAFQRSGRAGREVDGNCYRLCSKVDFAQLKEHSEPEIVKCCLSSAFLQMIAMGIDNVADFDFIDRPPQENIDSAIKVLKDLEAIVENDGRLELTECGKKMVVFPLDPRFSKMIVTSTEYQCTDEILSIVSMLSVENIFYSNTAQRDQFNKSKKKFESVVGDHMMLLRIYKEFKKSNNKKEWCEENYINYKSCLQVSKIRKQLFTLCEKLKMPLPLSCHCHVKVRKCIATGLFLNIALLHKINKKTYVYRMVENNQEVKIHPSSCLFKRESLSCVMFTELVQTSEVYMRTVSSMPEQMLVSVTKYFKDKPCRLAKAKPVPFYS